MSIYICILLALKWFDYFPVPSYFGCPEGSWQMQELAKSFILILHTRLPLLLLDGGSANGSDLSWRWRWRVVVHLTDQGWPRPPRGPHDTTHSLALLARLPRTISTSDTVVLLAHLIHPWRPDTAPCQLSNTYSTGVLIFKVFNKICTQTISNSVPPTHRHEDTLWGER